MDHEIEDTLPPGPGATDGTDELFPGDAELAAASCSICGVVGCRSYVGYQADPPAAAVFYCAVHEPAEIREERNMTLVLGIYETLAQRGLTNAESLSVLSLALHLVAHGKENLDGLQEGLRASEVKFRQLFPQLAAQRPAP
jgi:hypothetical protein